ncbi:MAG: hypothetical protein ACXWCY_24745 [Burkholderiales bacterium]
MTHVDDWEFFADKQGNWHWRSCRRIGAQAESRDSFESRTHCIADAMRHGYRAPEPGCQPETQATELY